MAGSCAKMGAKVMPHSRKKHVCTHTYIHIHTPFIVHYTTYISITRLNVIIWQYI